MDEGLGRADDGLEDPAVVLDDTVEAPDCTVMVPDDAVAGAPDHTVVVPSGTVEEQGHFGVDRDLFAAGMAQPVATK